MFLYIAFVGLLSQGLNLAFIVKHPVLQLTARGKHPGFSKIHLQQDRRNNDGADRDLNPGLLNLLPGALPIGQSGISI